MAEPDPEAVRRAAEDILSRPEYRQPEPGIVERVFGWVGEQIGRVFDALTGGGPGTVIGWIVVGALLLVAAYVLRRLFVLPGMPGRRSGAPTVEYGTSQRRSAASWREEAHRQRAAGERRNALRCHHQALVVELTDAGVLDPTPGRTTGEHRARLQAVLPEHAERIDAVTQSFERTWYGGSEVDDAELDRFVTDTEILVSAPSTVGVRS